jgi:hypothetical protein
MIEETGQDVAAPGQDLAALGVPPDNLRALVLLPLAYVAAASRRRDLALLDRLIENSARVAQLDLGAEALAHHWLRSVPTRQQFQQGLRLLRSACENNAGKLSMRDLIEAVLWAGSAAQLDRERIGRRYTSVSMSARRAIGELESVLGIDMGQLWSDVLDELGDDLPRSKNFIPPRLHT